MPHSQTEDGPAPSAEGRVATDDDVIYSATTGGYFHFGVQEVRQYCRDYGTTPEELGLRICEPHYAHEAFLDGSFFADILPDDCDLPDEIADAIGVFNAALEAFQEPLSWSAGKLVAIIPGIEEGAVS